MFGILVTTANDEKPGYRHHWLKKYDGTPALYFDKILANHFADLKQSQSDANGVNGVNYSGRWYDGEASETKS